MIAWAWLAIIVVMIVIEAITMGLTTIWFAGGALVAFIVALAGGGTAAQIILFFVVSAVLLIFTRPLIKKRFNVERVRTNAESLIGQQGIVTEDINNINASGEVKICGQDWMARTETNNHLIPKDTIVTVKAIEGVKLIVEESGEER